MIILPYSFGLFAYLPIGKTVTQTCLEKEHPQKMGYFSEGFELDLPRYLKSRIS